MRTPFRPLLRLLRADTRTATGPISAEYLEAWKGMGRWEQGVSGGEWPDQTLFERDVLERPPAWIEVKHKLVYINGAGSDAVYCLAHVAHPLILEHLKNAGHDAYVGVLNCGA